MFSFSVMYFISVTFIQKVNISGCSLVKLAETANKHYFSIIKLMIPSIFMNILQVTVVTFEPI